MAGKPKTLKIKFDGDATGLESATKQAGATLERLEDDAKRAAGGMNRVGDAGEGVADSSSLATGALGALSSGFELIGADKAAESLQRAALATDFMSGVGDSLTLVTQKLGLAKIKDTAATVKNTVVTKTSTAATKAQTIAQKGLNLALRMNPIGIVITAVAGLIAILVLAYKKSETFRRIVDAAFGAVKRAASAAWSGIKAVWSGFGSWFADKWNALVRGVTGLPGRISRAAGGMWDGIKDAFRSSVNWIIEKWNSLSFTLPSVDTRIPGLGKVGGFTLSTPNIGYLAGGGYAAPGRTYVVGESGPELLTMGGRGFVTPNGRLQAGETLDVRALAAELMALLAELIRGEISLNNRTTKRRALAGRTA